MIWFYSHAFQNGSRYYSPGYRGINMVCEVDECPVGPLAALTDPVAIDHEKRKYEKTPDLEHVVPEVREGLACIVQKVAALGGDAHATSGYRPPQYQAHFVEIYQKWLQLKDNESEACRKRKQEITAEKNLHKIHIAVPNSKHPTGLAVDISGVPESSADEIAALCNMYRPDPKRDAVHYQPRRMR